MNILIVHAHHEPQSFCSALANTARQVLHKQGHSLVFNDLYAQGFDPISDRRNFLTCQDPNYLKQQLEEKLASEQQGFEPKLEAEIAKLEACDFLIFSFPLWWFSMPAILKGWVDRVFAMGRIYGGAKLYEGGIGQARKRAMVLMTTGGGSNAYDGYGLNPSLDTILKPIHHGIFWFNGFLPLEPLVAWSPVRISPEERQSYLQQLEERLATWTSQDPIHLPPLADFAGGTDGKPRFMLQFNPAVTLDLQDLQRQGKVLESHHSQAKTYVVVRVETLAEAKALAQQLSSAPCEVEELRPSRRN